MQQLVAAHQVAVWAVLELMCAADGSLEHAGVRDSTSLDIGPGECRRYQLGAGEESGDADR